MYCSGIAFEVTNILRVSRLRPWRTCFISCKLNRFILGNGALILFCKRLWFLIKKLQGGRHESHDLSINNTPLFSATTPSIASRSYRISSIRRSKYDRKTKSHFLRSQTRIKPIYCVFLP